MLYLLFLGNITFAEFLQILVEEFNWNTKNRMNEHWRPQYVLCHPCFIDYDFVGRFEHLNDDAKHVLAKLTACLLYTSPSPRD